MCVDPVTATFLVSAGLNAAKTATDFVQQSAEAKSSGRFADASESLAQEAAAAQYRSIRTRQLEQREVTAQEIEDTAREAAQAAGRVRVSGAAGGSVGATVRDLAAQELRFRNRAMSRQQFSDLQADAEADAARRELRGRQLSIAASRQPRPSLLGAALNLAGGTLQSFTSASSMGGGQTPFGLFQQ